MSGKRIVRDAFSREGGAKGRFGRRAFLRGAAGAVVALPFLTSMRVHAQSTVFPKRLLLVYTPNGVTQEDWWPTNTSETGWDLRRILEPFAGYKDKLTLLKGVNIQVAQTGPGGPHQKGLGGLWTGNSLQEGDFVDGCGSRAGWANGISVDQEIANVVGLDTLLPSLEVGVRAIQSDVRARMSYKGPGQPLPPMNDPRDVYFRLFAGFQSDPTELEAMRSKRKSVLETVQQQFAALTPRLSVEDRNKLDQHLALVRDVERRLDILPVDGSTCGVPTEPPILNEDDENDMPEIADLQADMISMAFACDATRVASLQLSSAINRLRFPWQMSNGEGHTLSHAGSNSSGAFTERTERLKWYAERIVRVMDNLAQIQEGDGSVLDNTLIVWGNEVSKGNLHTHQDIPFLMIGSAGGYFQTGRYLEYAGEPHNKLLVSILHAMGIEADNFGHPDYTNGPLSGLTV